MEPFVDSGDGAQAEKHVNVEYQIRVLKCSEYFQNKIIRVSKVFQSQRGGIFHVRMLHKHAEDTCFAQICWAMDRRPPTGL